MGNVCRICHTPCMRVVPLIEESPNSKELKPEGKEFEYCFNLKVLEVPKYTGICVQCQQQLHSFYLFKQKAIKSHYELLNKANKVKVKHDVEVELSNQSENVEIENSKSDNEILNEPINTEFEKTDNNDECNNSSIVCVDATNDVNENSRDSDDDKVESEKKNDLKLKSLESKQKSNKRSKLSQNHRRFFRFDCEICGKRFMLKENFEAHMNIHKGLPAYSCKICGKSYKVKEHMEYHMKNHNNQRDFVCKICSKGFITNSNLHVHMACHNEQKQFICDECGKLFRYSSQLTVHKQTHSNKRFECSTCHAKLRSKEILKKHVLIIHDKYKNPKLFCTVCDKQFHKKNRFTAHMAKKHPENKKT